MEQVRVVFGGTRWGTMTYLADDDVGSVLKMGMLHEEGIVMGVLHNIVARARVILDIGAHAGSHCLLYARINPAARIHAFEPQKQQYAVLRHNIHTFGVGIIAHNIALGNKDCEASMCGFVRDGPNAGEPVVAGKTFNLGGLQIGRGGEAVRIRRLDDMAAELELETVSYIKLDVEGFENFVLDGGYETIKKHKPVIFFEHAHKHIEDDMAGYYDKPRHADAFATLQSLGYYIINIGDGNFLAI